MKAGRLLPSLLLVSLGFVAPPAVAAPAATPPAVQQALEKAIGGPQRTPAFAMRDRWRHPLQTLEFFGIRPDMTVVEVLPGGGWYTEILAPFLHDHGRLIEATTPAGGASGFARKMAARSQVKLAADPAVYGRVMLQPFAPPAYLDLGPPDSVDMIVTFRNMHDLIYANVHGAMTDAIMQGFLRSAWRALKPGGILGIVGHLAAADMPIPRTRRTSRSGTCRPRSRTARQRERPTARITRRSAKPTT